jgi:hypothetical protein
MQRYSGKTSQVEMVFKHKIKVMMTSAPDVDYLSTSRCEYGPRKLDPNLLKNVLSAFFVFLGRISVRQKHGTRAHAKKQQECSTRPTAVCVCF